MKSIYQVKNSVAIVVLAALLTACNSMPATVSYSELSLAPYTKREVRDGITYVFKLRHKPFIYNYKSEPYTGKVLDYYPERGGNLRSEGRMKNGFPDGIWKYYYRDGKLEMQGKFIEGNADSVWNKYYEDGTPSTIEYYVIKNDTVHCDTLAAWYDNHKPMIERNGDTTTFYYPNNRVGVYSVGKPPRWEVTFSPDGRLTSKIFDYHREVYSSPEVVVRRIFYLQTQNGREYFWKQKYSWSEEQRKAIAKADSVEFDYTNRLDPVIKIYQPE